MAPRTIVKDFPTDAYGVPQSTARWEAYLASNGQLLANGGVGADGSFSVGTADIAAQHRNAIIDVKVLANGFVWWLRGTRAAQVAELSVETLLRLPRYTTTERDALGLNADDRGVIIYNTTTEQLEWWNGAAWAAGGGGGGGGTTVTPGSIGVTPSVIRAYTDVDGDYTFAAEDLDVTALNAANVDQYEIWFKDEAVHQQSTWTPVADFVTAFNVSTSEETQIGLVATDKLIPVRLVFRSRGSFVSLINTWLEIGDLASDKQDALPTLGEGQVWAGPSATPTRLPTGGGGSGQAGSISLTPSVIPNAAGVQRDFKFAFEDLDVTALNAAGVNEFELWIKDTAFHAVDPWVPAADGVIDVNVNATEALAIAIGNAEIVPVRMVFRNGGTFVSLINTWLEIRPEGTGSGTTVEANPTVDSGDGDLTSITIDGEDFHIRDDQSFRGDHIVREFVNGNAALGLVLARHATATDHRARLLVMTADATTVYNGTTYTYENGDVVYFPPTSIAAEPWFNIRQDLLTNQQKAELIDVRLGISAIVPTAANLQREISVFFDAPAILGPTVYAEFRVAGQGPATRQLMAQAGGRVRFTLTQAQAEAISNNVTQDQTTIGVNINLYDAASSGNLLATVHRDLTVLAEGDGSPGAPGVNGSFERTIFRAASSRPATPTSPNSVTGGANPALPASWSASPPGGTTAIWASVQRVARGATAVTYTTPVRWDGEDGTDGATGARGPTGATGPAGATGAKGSNGTSITLTRYASAAAAPATVPANTIAYWPRPSS